MLNLTFRWRPGPAVAGHLKAPAPPSPIALLLAAGFLYQLLNQPGAVSDLTAPFIVGWLILVLWRAPGWLVYLGLFLALAVQTYYRTQVTAFVPPYLAATRDRAAIATAQALAHGLNPWTHTPNLPVPATTGAASILFVLPFVMVFGNIAFITYLFWLAMFAFVAISDLRLRNGHFPPLALLVVMGILGFSHTMEWRLEELYFPYLFLLLAYHFLRRGRFLACGLMLAVPPLWRVSYCFMVLAFLLWSLFDRKASLRQYARMGIGSLVATVAILLPFVIVGGREFLEHNFYTIAQGMGDLWTWPRTNLLYRLVAKATSGLAPASLQLLKEIAVVLLIAGTARVARRRFDHPFWHVSVAAFLSHTLLWQALMWIDYALIFVIPASLAVAMTRPSVPPGEKAVSAANV